MFFRRGKLKKEYDEKLIHLMRETQEEWKQAQIIEDLQDDYDLSVIATRKIAECKHFFLFKEAKIRKILIK
ncbi:MAG: YaaL family protein [Paenisporosarcina sp.]